MTVFSLFKRKAPAVAFAALLTGILTSVHTDPSLAEDKAWRHGTSLIGELKYPPGFSRFDYVNPDAPKGGTLNMSVNGSFDTLNPFLAKGDMAAGIEALIYESLMTPSLDEISSQYGLLAESVSYPDDYSSVTYRLRPEARWHDGEPVTVEDVIWSFEKSIELDPQRQFYYQHVTGAEKTGDHEVTFTFDEKNNRELPNIVGQILVLPKHWWEGTDATGKQRSIGETTLEPPLGSGPYRVSRVSPGSDLEFELVDDYWGKELPVNIGTNNFGEVKFGYFADRNAEFVAFTSGNIDYWTENKAARWAKEYDFPAANDGRITREMLENAYRTRGVMVGFVPNLRRQQFTDPRVRKALNLAFDFEDLNKTIFFDQYERIDSFFFGSELASDGLPEGKELEILETVRDKIPEEVFTQPYENPVSGNARNLRSNLREAVRLFREAGYEIRDGKMVNAETGKPFTFEILLNGPIIERVALPFAENLKKIGIEASVRTIDPAQYQNRIRGRDFDVIYTGQAQSLSPGNEQFEYWGSQSANREGSANYGGIANEAVDELIRRVVFAGDRDELIAATRALDRVLLANQYYIPSYTVLNERIAYWNHLVRPDPLPEYSVGFPTIWWSKDAAQ